MSWVLISTIFVGFCDDCFFFKVHQSWLSILVLKVSAPNLGGLLACQFFSSTRVLVLTLSLSQKFPLKTRFFSLPTLTYRVKASQSPSPRPPSVLQFFSFNFLLLGHLTQPTDVFILGFSWNLELVIFFLQPFQQPLLHSWFALSFVLAALQLKSETSSSYFPALVFYPTSLRPTLTSTLSHAFIAAMLRLNGLVHYLYSWLHGLALWARRFLRRNF